VSADNAWSILSSALGLRDFLLHAAQFFAQFPLHFLYFLYLLQDVIRFYPIIITFALKREFHARKALQ